MIVVAHTNEWPTIPVDWFGYRCRKVIYFDKIQRRKTIIALMFRVLEARGHEGRNQKNETKPLLT